MVDLETLNIFPPSDLCGAIVLSSLPPPESYKEPQGFFTGMILLPPMFYVLIIVFEETISHTKVFSTTISEVTIVANFINQDNGRNDYE